MEFSPVTASPLGLPWEQHERCRVAFESGLLQSFFAAGAAIGAATAQQATAGSSPARNVCTAALALMTCALGWDFRYELPCGQLHVCASCHAFPCPELVHIQLFLL